MSMKSKMLALLAMNYMVDPLNPIRSSASINNVTGKLPTTPQPKGTKEYFFDHEGNIEVDLVRTPNYVVFKCFAINDASAKKKYLKWLNSTPNVSVSDTTEGQ